MPLIKSAKKRMKQDIKKTARNNVFRNRMRTRIKDLEKAVHDKEEGIDEKLKAAQSAIDTAQKKNLLHKNTAGRKKSALMKKVDAAKK